MKSESRSDVSNSVVSDSLRPQPGWVEWVAHPFCRDLLNPGIEPGSSALQADSLPTEL